MCKSMRPLLSVKCLIVGGCPITKSFVESLPSVFPNAVIKGGYATSECEIITMNYTKSANRCNSGVVFANTDVKVF